MSPARLIHGASFDPETTSLMAAAFDEACRVAGQAQPPLVKEVMAKRIIEAAHRGERDVQRLKEFALAGPDPGNAQSQMHLASAYEPKRPRSLPASR
jgi:hypothetical protein